MATFKRMNDQQFINLCEKGDIQGVIEAIHSGVNVNAEDKDGYTALMLAAYNGHTEIVNALIKAGANVKNGGGVELMLAEYNGYAETVNALIKARADVNAENNKGRTVLIFAAGNGHTEIVNALIKAGANVNVKADGGWTALMSAARNGHTEIVNALIEAGADDLTDNYGKTALIYAAEYGNAETVNALIDAGSYVKQKTKSGKTALDYARKNYSLKYSPVIKRLEELSR